MIDKIVKMFDAFSDDDELTDFDYEHCERPPLGWKCFLENGHSGPCPAKARWWNLRARIGGQA